MDRMKKILTSPITKKKSVVTSSRYFGVPLEELTRREETAIPQLVQKICVFIQTHGKDHGQREAYLPKTIHKGCRFVLQVLLDSPLSAFYGLLLLRVEP